MKVADSLLKEKAIQGKTNVNGPRTTPAPSESQPRVPRNISTPNGPPNQGGPVGTQGGGIV
jgi:hypothetical protein